MAGLMDSIKQQLAGPGEAPQLGETEQARGLLRAKLGKAGGAESTPRQSNIGEQVAQQQTNLGLQDIAQQGKIGAEQLSQQQADQAQNAKQAQVQHQEQLRGMQQQFADKSLAIADELAQQAQTLDVNQRLAKMEQAGFMGRLSNDQYIQQLQNQGKMQRLDNQQNFRYAAAEDIMKDQQELLGNDIKFRKMLDSSDREFDEALANMSNDFAIRMGEKAAKAAAATAKYSGIAQLGGAAISAAGTAGDKGLFNSLGSTGPEMTPEQQESEITQSRMRG